MILRPHPKGSSISLCLHLSAISEWGRIKSEDWESWSIYKFLHYINTEHTLISLKVSKYLLTVYYYRLGKFVLYNCNYCNFTTVTIYGNPLIYSYIDLDIINAHLVFQTVSYLLTNRTYEYSKKCRKLISLGRNHYKCND